MLCEFQIDDTVIWNEPDGQYSRYHEYGEKGIVTHIDDPYEGAEAIVTVQWEKDKLSDGYYAYRLAKYQKLQMAFEF